MSDVPNPNEPVSDGSGDSGIQKQPESIDPSELLSQHQEILANNQTEAPQLRSADGTDCEFSGSDSTRMMTVDAKNLDNWNRMGQEAANSGNRFSVARQEMEQHRLMVNAA